MNNSERGSSYGTTTWPIQKPNPPGSAVWRWSRGGRKRVSIQEGMPVLILRPGKIATNLGRSPVVRLRFN